MRSFCSAKASLIFSTKNISVFGYKVLRRLTRWPLNELVKLTMLWTTGPRFQIWLEVKLFQLYIGFHCMPQSLSQSPSHHLDMTEILRKGGKIPLYLPMKKKLVENGVYLGGQGCRYNDVWRMTEIVCDFMTQDINDRNQMSFVHSVSFVWIQIKPLRSLIYAF